MDNKNEGFDVELLQYWNILKKRKWLIFAVAAFLVFFTGVFSFMATPIYSSKATVLIEDASDRMLSVDETFGFQAPVVRDLRFFNTQIQLIRSKTLAERVARKMNLLNRPEFQSRGKRGIFSAVKSILTLKWLRKKKSGGSEEGSAVPVNPYSLIANGIVGGIEVVPIRDTKLVEVHYKSAYPQLTADLINNLLNEYINFSVEMRYENTQMASDFLSEQITTVREELNNKERELQRYGEEKDLLFLNQTESSAVNSFSELNQAYTAARIERIKAEANYRELRNLNVDALPEFVSNPTIRQLSTTYSQLKNDYQDKIRIYKPDYPDMVRLQARIESVKAEIENVVEAAETEYRAALTRERNLLADLNRQRREVTQNNSDAILYNSLQIEIDNLQQTLSSLIEKQRTTQISSQLGGLRAGNVSIIDKAEVPLRPVSPRKAFNLMLSLVLGLCGGIGLVFLLDYLDNTVKGPKDVEKLSSVPSLGFVSFLNPESLKSVSGPGEESSQFSLDRNGEGGGSVSVELVNHKFPKLFIAEDYRTIRTSLLLSHAENPPRTILFTSALPKEGKTSTAVNMAVAFAQLEKKVLLIDADLRKPRLHGIFHINNRIGLSGYLTGKIQIDDAVQMTSIDNVFLLSSGVIPPNPAELLNSKKMSDLMRRVRDDFDVVLVDSPPVMAVVDPVIVSAMCESTVFVVRAGKTPNRSFQNSVNELRQVKSKIAGVVFNEMKAGMDGQGYTPYYRYYRTGYESEEQRPSV